MSDTNFSVSSFQNPVVKVDAKLFYLGQRAFPAENLANPSWHYLAFAIHIQVSILASNVQGMQGIKVGSNLCCMCAVNTGLQLA